MNYDTFNQLRSKCAFISVNHDTFNQLDHELLLRKKKVYATRVSLSLKSTVRLRTWKRERAKDGRFQGGDDLKTSAMENRDLWLLLFQKIRPFQGRNLELVTHAVSPTWYVFACTWHGILDGCLMFWGGFVGFYPSRRIGTCTFACFQSPRELPRSSLRLLALSSESLTLALTAGPTSPLV